MSIVKRILILWIIGCALFSNQSFSFDLMTEISEVFSSSYNKWKNSDYMNDAYNPNFSKDPFWDNLDLLEEQSLQKKIAWAEMVSENLSNWNCAMDPEKVRAILYYFSPDFRNEILMSIKSESDDFSSHNFNLNQQKVLEYCREYYFCVNYDVNDIEENTKENKITAQTAENIMTNCKESFLQSYEFGSQNQERIQSLESIQLWKDKYTNASTDDSPYDIISDLKNIWVVAFEDIEEPITPIFFNIPAFYKSAKKIQDAQNWNNGKLTSSTDEENFNSQNESNPWVGTNLWWNWNSNPIGEIDLWDVETEWIIVESNNWKKVTYVEPDIYDYLVEWLNSLKSANQSNSLFYGKTCWWSNDNSDDIEEDIVLKSADEKEQLKSDNGKAVSNEDYQTAVDYMKSSLGNYGTLPDEIKNEITGKWWNKQNPPVSADGLEALADEIKNCMSACDELRWDQRATCKVMCACFETWSKIFDPEQNPWLWPIFTVRGCFVPGVNYPYSEWWTKMVSIELWSNEIFWALDKLSREWKLWTWVKEHNFLDSSTKNMKFGDMISFSFSIEQKNLSSQKSEKSEQFQDMELKRTDKNLQETYNISNPLNDPVARNNFRIIGGGWDTVWDYSASSNSDKNRDDLDLLDTRMQMAEDPQKTSDALRYISLETSITSWLDQQAAAWDEITNVLWDMINMSEALNQKR